MLMLCGPCCGPPRCDRVVWPNTLFLTTFGNTFTLPRFSGNWWQSAWTSVTHPDAHDTGCVSVATARFQFNVRCNPTTLVWNVSYDFAAWFCSPNIWYPSTNEHAGVAGSGSVVSSWTDIPVDITGTWNATSSVGQGSPITGTYDVTS